MIRLHAIDAGTFKVDGGAMFGVVPRILWGKHVAADENNLTRWAMRCLLVESGNRCVLIDAGVGLKQGERFAARYHIEGSADIGEAVRASGFAEEDITDVILTHLHFDHVGGLVRRAGDTLTPVFSRAAYWVTRAQWDAAVRPNARERASFLAENVLPLRESGRLRFLDDGAPGIEGIELAVSHGHTAGQIIPRILYGGRTLVFAADLVPSRWHVPLPYIMAYDLAPLRLLEEKERLLREAADGNHVLFLEHDPDVECCTVACTEKDFRVDREFALSELTA